MVFIHGASCARGVGGGGAGSGAGPPTTTAPGGPPPPSSAVAVPREPFCCAYYEDADDADAVVMARSARWHRDLLDLMLGGEASCCCQPVEKGADAYMWASCSSARRASVAPEVSQPPAFVVPYQRSKSRSVDHGFSPPFDLDSLRHTVDGRMQSAEKLSRAGECPAGVPRARGSGGGAWGSDGAGPCRDGGCGGSSSGGRVHPGALRVLPVPGSVPVGLGRHGVYPPASASAAAAPAAVHYATRFVNKRPSIVSGF
ncbi:hypothetical protein ONE63_001453 [Megalurothrips usitatus]|uniref:Uncharacterized protein n=1 Tax=Megalurothrips usitatus TaxID=439358 RepID=A0AAV7XIP7_9NEOP|nr:hypothetical protein ONE63_001453 [Megalurothrips usitatus]